MPPRVRAGARLGLVLGLVCALFLEARAQDPVAPGDQDVTWYNLDTIRTPEAETGVCGWELVRYLPLNSVNWHPVDDRASGNGGDCTAYNTPTGCSNYGTYNDATNAWSVTFGNFDEFVFATCGLQNWVQVSKEQAIGTGVSGSDYAADAQSRTYIKSSRSSSGGTAIWVNDGSAESPWIGLLGHGTQTVNTDSGDRIMYAEGAYSTSHWADASRVLDGGMCVFARDSTAAESVCQGNAATPAPAPAAAACPTTASAQKEMEASSSVATWNAELKAHDLAAGDTLVFAPQQPPTLNVARGFTAVVLARPDAPGQTGDLVTLADGGGNTIAQIGAGAGGAITAACPDGAGTVNAAEGATLHDPNFIKIWDFTAVTSHEYLSAMASADSYFSTTMSSHEEVKGFTGYAAMGIDSDWGFYMSGDGKGTFTFTVPPSYSHAFVFTGSCDDEVGDEVNVEHSADSGSSWTTKLTIGSMKTGTVCFPVAFDDRIKIYEETGDVCGATRVVLTTMPLPACTLEASRAWPPADTSLLGLGVYALVVSDDPANAKVYAPDASGNFLHAGAGVGGCSGFAGVGASVDMGTNLARCGAADGEAGCAVTERSNCDSCAVTFAKTEVVDGVTNNVLENGKSWIGDSSTDQWIQIDLGASKSVKIIKIWFRGDNFITRADDFDVYIGDIQLQDNAAFPADFGEACHDHSGTPDNTETISCIGIGQYVTIALFFGYVGVGEVEVYDPDTTASTPGALAAGYSLTLGGGSHVYTGTFGGTGHSDEVTNVYLVNMNPKTFIAVVASSTGTGGNIKLLTFTLLSGSVDTSSFENRYLPCSNWEHECNFLRDNNGLQNQTAANYYYHYCFQGSNCNSIQGSYEISSLNAITSNMLLGEAFVAPRALSRAELGLAIHGLAGYDGTEPTGDHDRWYTFDGDLNSYHDRAARRRAAAEAEAAAVVGQSPFTGEPINLARACGADGQQACATYGINTWGSDFTNIHTTLVDGDVCTIDNAAGIGVCFWEADPGSVTDFWRVDLGQISKILQIKHHARSDLAPERAQNFRITVSNENSVDSSGNSPGGDTPCFTHDGSAITVTTVTTGTCDAEGRYVFFTGAGSHNADEIEVLGYHLPYAASATATLTPGNEVYAPAPARRLYALEVAAAQTLVAPVDSTFNWAGEWTVAAWLRAGAGASGAVLSVVDGGASVIHVVDMCTLVQSVGVNSGVNFARDCSSVACPVSESANYDANTYPKTNVNDGTKNTGSTDDNFWHAADSSDQWLMIDLEIIRTVQNVKIWFRNVDSIKSRQNNFKLWIGQDASSYNLNANCFSYDGTPGIFEPDGFSCCGYGRYLFISGGPSMSISEIEVYGPAPAHAATPAWTHVALTYDGSGTTASLHVDGGAGTSVAFSGLATGGSVRITEAAVDDLRVFSGQALTLPQVQAIAGVVFDPNAPVAHWDFEDAGVVYENIGSGYCCAGTCSSSATHLPAVYKNDATITENAVIQLCNNEITCLGYEIVGDVKNLRFISTTATTATLISGWTAWGSGCTNNCIIAGNDEIFTSSGCQKKITYPVAGQVGSLAVETAAGQTLVAPVPAAFDWTGAWTVAAWLRAGAGASGAVLTLEDGGAASLVAADVRSAENWYLSQAGQTCDNKCASLGLIPDKTEMNKIDTSAEIENLATLFGITCTTHNGKGPTMARDRAGIPAIDTANRCVYLTPGATTDTSTTPIGSVSDRPLCYCIPQNPSAADLTPGVWTHVALTYDGSAADAQLHVNGGAGTAVPLGSLATSTSPGGSVRITGAAVDDLRVYASDLSGSLEQAGALSSGQYITDLETKAQEKTGVTGWVLYRHLPAASSSWFSGEDNALGVFSKNAITKLENEEWATSWSGGDELLFSKDNFATWLRIATTDINSKTSWHWDLTPLGSSTNSQYSLYIETKENEYAHSPFIFLASEADHSIDNMMYQEYGDKPSSVSEFEYPYIGSPLNVAYDVFVRDSTTAPAGGGGGGGGR